VNWRHFQAFLWLRWRLRINQLKRGGIANTVILALLAVAAVLFAASAFFISLLVGLFALPGASSSVLLYVWDGLVVAFLFCWTIGLISDLQRSEALSLEKLLHLPVSLTSAFLINYLSSLFSLTLIVFLPAMLGLSLGLIFAKGPALLLLFPLLAAFLLMITALTYQFQGWLATLMANPRRRRTVIVFVTAGFILLCQLPNLLNFFQPWTRHQQDDFAELVRQQTELQRSLQAGTITRAQFQHRHQEIHTEFTARRTERDRRFEHQAERTAGLLNLVLPPGWLPLGAAAAVEGKALPPVLGTLGLTLIGLTSLGRSYRTTVRLYTGQYSSGKRRPAVVTAAPPATAGKPTSNLLEKDLPWLSEQAAVVALGAFRSLLRAPEAKMMLLSPIFMVVIFGSMLVSRSGTMPEAIRPLLPLGAVAMILLSMGQLICNQFGLDRDGFRVFVLCPARRRDILLGKNLAFAPWALGLGLPMVILLQVVYPMRLDYLLAVLPQSILMYLLYCMAANWLSIFAPVPFASGTLRPVNFKAIPALLHVAFFFLLPLLLSPALVPLAVQLVLESLDWTGGVPICLILSLVECVVIVFVYRLLLTWQGQVLHAREQLILKTVTTKE
jgi:hypothetical protein